MTVRIGSLSTVERRSLGGTVVADALAGASSLVLDLVSDFDEDGGSVMVGETALTYTAADFDSDTLTLSAPLAADVPADTPALSLTSDGQEEVEWIAAVDLGDDEDGDAVSATIPTALVGYFVEGSDQAGMLVEVEGTAEGWRVRSQPTQVPELDAGVVQTPVLSAYLTTTTSIASGGAGEEVTNWTVESSTTDTIALDSGEFVVSEPGHYSVMLTGRWASNGTGRRMIWPEWQHEAGAVDGPQDNRPAEAIAGLTVHINDVRYLEAGEGMRVVVFQSSGANLNLLGGATQSTTTVRIVRVGP